MAYTMSYASLRDRNPCSRDVTFYGAFIDIIEIHCMNDVKFFLFQVWLDWYQYREKARWVQFFNG